MIDLKQLEDLAKKASPGPWIFDEWQRSGIDGEPLDSGYRVHSDGRQIHTWACEASWTEKDEQNALYVAFANPAVILELIETQRMLVEALQSLLKLASENLPLEECEEYEQAHAAIQKATGE